MTSNLFNILKARESCLWQFIFQHLGQLLDFRPIRISWIKVKIRGILHKARLAVHQSATIDGVEILLSLKNIRLLIYAFDSLFQL